LEGGHPIIVSAKFGWYWLSSFGDFFLNFIPSFAEMILGWPPSKIVSVDPDFQPRWPPS
jgi:hypothetical protein